MQIETIIDLQNVAKTFETSYGMFTALKDISLQLKRGEMVAMVGKSGSGKSTLMNIITGIDRPTKGTISVEGVSIGSLSESQLAIWRGKTIGVVFQFFQLLPTLTVLENIMLPMDFCNSFPKKERKDRAMTLLNNVGIVEQANKFPMALSGGQQQRAAIARALANDPPIIVADEPTGNLDSHSANAIFDLFGQLAKAGKTVVVITHEREFAHYFQHTITLADGAIMSPVMAQNLHS